MSAVEVTISGILFDKVNRTSQNVVLIGEATLTGLAPGGGPVIPPAQPPSGGGGKPPEIWPGPGPLPHPEHPIVLPPPGDKPPIDSGTPPVSWKPVWHPTEGWIVVGIINPEIPHPVPSSEPPPAQK